jgi:hypothetical protein
MKASLMKASFIVDPALQNDRIFDLSNRILNRDDCLYGFWTLRKALAAKGVELRTCDLHRPEESDLVLLNERPTRKVESSLRNYGALKKSVLMIFESELIRPDNWDLRFHQEVAGVLTWSSDLLEGRSPHTGEALPSTGQAKANAAKYARGGFTHKFPSTLPDGPRSKLCTLIAGNKSVMDRRELYSKRREAIDWFERNAANDFTYYGIGWEHYYLKGGLGTKILKKFGILGHLPERRTKCFGGRVQEKLETLRTFDFSICFENAENIAGYISEKIFDSFFAGCIPVYWGAPDIADYIPTSCFIDFRKFESLDDLYHHLKNMKSEAKSAYRNEINLFLKSQKSLIFNADEASKIHADSILNFLKVPR